MFKTKLKIRNRSPRLTALLALGLFLLLLYCNLHTDLVADDYRYCFSFRDDSRITVVGQIFPSMAAHRHSMNGRVIAHFLVQLFLLLPKGVFNVLNAACFTLLVWELCRLALPKRTGNALLFVCVFGCLWLLQPEFGQVFLWLDGSVNYLWCALLCMLWLRPWAERFRSGKTPSPAAQFGFALFSLLVGAYSENASVALIAMALLFLAADWFFFRRKPESWQLLSLLLAFCGFLYMMLAPAESVNKSTEWSIRVLLGNFVETAGFYLRFWPLLLSYPLLYFCAVKKQLPLRDRLLSLIFLFGSLAGHFVLTFAMYCAGRSTYIGLVLLVAANALLFAPLLDRGLEVPLTLVSAVLLVCTLWALFVGVRDILRTDYLLDFNEALIVECLANGEREISVPRPYAKTKYSALEGLGYLSTEDAEDWLNVYMAKYYGADRLIAY